MRHSFNIFFTLLPLVPLVAAHGYLKSVTIDGTSYSGNEPTEEQPNPQDSAIRQIATNGPIKLVTDPGLACGADALPAALTAQANPGSAVAFQWRAINGNWIHDHGPLMAYMAECKGVPCNEFNATEGDWFKIAELGQKNDSTHEWYQKDLTEGKPYNATIPKNLKAGPYLLRSEIISLQIATSVGGAEYYPSCIQIEIKGNGDGAPNSTMKIGDLYNPASPGLVVPDIYNPGYTYAIFPGPPIAEIAPQDGPTGGDTTDAASPTVNTSEPSPASTSASPSNASSFMDVPISASATLCACSDAAPWGTQQAHNNAIQDSATPSPAITSATDASQSQPQPCGQSSVPAPHGRRLLQDLVKHRVIRRVA
ncbi:glycosyl hydrolase family 61-domain-containing protein [Trametes maxima]|nr:glycosyl hydrolase family 61-domain-containing protein [Trametes maxima]